MQVLHGCTFSLCQTHIRARDTKIRKKWKRRQKVKKSSKSDIAPFGPQSGTKQSIWRGYPTGRERGDVGLESKTDPKRRFRSSKIDEKPRRILRILLFSSSGFSNRLWQNDKFCCMICTSFWNQSRSKEALEMPLQCKMCSLTQARSKIIKMHSFTVDTQKCSFWRQVLDENAIRVCHFERWIFPSYTF